MTTIRTAQIIGFFSLPSASLAEHNPTAYNLAMAGAPAGAGSCSHCGTGIRHHVVIRDETGTTRFVGQDCAAKIGLDQYQLRNRMTDAQRAEHEAKCAKLEAEWSKKQAYAAEMERLHLARRREEVGDIVDMLQRLGTEFHASLAAQLERGPLSPRQAHCVAKATSATGRRNKRNAEAWDDVEARCQDNRYSPFDDSIEYHQSMA